jgi:predicted aminopeptidase
VLRLLALLLLCLPLTGCYLMQAANGQMQLLSKRLPVAKVIANPQTAPTLRTRLEYVAAARDFASRELGLPDNRSYRSYADVGRQFVVWNVFATDEFSVEPRHWCFPIAGCVVYRGYFSEHGAQRYARKLRLRGADASVGGVAAYSTLGHFDDPVLNTMLNWSDAQLAATLFHELAHQVVYVPGDSGFNEAFATVVEEVGLERWLAARDLTRQLAGWRAQRERGDQFIELLLATRERLRDLYRTQLPREQLRARKQQEFGRLKFEYWQLKARWNGYSGYDYWFDRALNNAHLITAATYHGCLPAFKNLLAATNGDLPQFYERVRMIAKQSHDEREQGFCQAS